VAARKQSDLARELGRATKRSIATSATSKNDVSSRAFAGGEPLHERGVSRSAGLYFVGLHFLYAMSSSMIHGVGRDAARIAGLVAAARGKLASQAAMSTPR
jgi:hypothetical protein